MMIIILGGETERSDTQAILDLSGGKVQEEKAPSPLPPMTIHYSSK